MPFQAEQVARIAVVTDSAACIPADLVQRYSIQVVPFVLVWDGQSYRDGQDLTPTEFYRRLRASASLPTTSRPPQQAFADLYRRLGQAVEGIVSIHVPETLSGTVSEARVAAGQASPVPVAVIDSRTAAMAEGFVVLAAARAAKAGGSLEDVTAAAEQAIPRVGLYATLETLEYLQRGGRIGEAVSLLGSRLHLHPTLYLAEARVQVAGVVRSRHRAMERMLQLMAEQVGEQPVHVATFHADAQDEAEQLAAEACARFHCRESYVTAFTPVMGVHTGPGTLGVAFAVQQGAQALAWGEQG
jgi:DegV family protein with EDD domain